MRARERLFIAFAQTTGQLYGFNIYDKESSQELVKFMLHRTLPLNSYDKYIYQKRYYYKKKFTKLLDYARK